MVPLPPPPIRSPITMANNSIHPIWVQWFQLFYERVGGAIAPDVQDLTLMTSFDDLDKKVTKQDIINALTTFQVMQDTPKAYENRLHNIEVMAAYGGY